MPESLAEQAQRLYRVFAELVRAYQFRDRDQTCCHGLSVSQCYSLDALDAEGPLTMGELATLLHLELSSVTRIVDHLVANRLATRTQDQNDRRVCRVKVSAKGRALAARIRGELIAEHEAVLRQIQPEGREAVISAMSLLLSAFQARRPDTATPGRPGTRGAQSVTPQVVSK
jgi:DNA-binding MarR family transcriptional regulator